MIHWFFGWGSILCAFLSGAAVGVFFHRDDFLGGYGSFRRRMVRLGHIALAGLGIINVLYALAFWSGRSPPEGAVASLGLIVGGVTMPTVCFLSAWRSMFRALFFIPVAALIIAVVQILRVGMP